MVRHLQTRHASHTLAGGNRSYVARRFHSGETEAPLLLAATSPPATIDPALYLPPALRQAPCFCRGRLAVLRVTCPFPLGYGDCVLQLLHVLREALCLSPGACGDAA